MHINTWEGENEKLQHVRGRAYASSNLECTGAHTNPYLPKENADQGEHCTQMETFTHKGVNVKLSTRGKSQGSRKDWMKSREGKAGRSQAGVYATMKRTVDQVMSCRGHLLEA